jgi:tripartite-type tricarboxylate transporter receptor subunit TctC
VDWFLLPLAVAVPLVKTGKLTALSIGAATRSAVLPDVPTTTECGFADADHTFWVGMFAPAKTPAAVLARLHAETVRALNSDEARPRLEKLGAEPAPMPQQQFAKRVREETAATAALIKQAGIRLES